MSRDTPSKPAGRGPRERQSSSIISRSTDKAVEQQAYRDLTEHTVKAKDDRILQLKGWLTLLVRHPLIGTLIRLRRLVAGRDYVGPEDVIDKAGDPHPGGAETSAGDKGSELESEGRVYPSIRARYSPYGIAEVLHERVAESKGLFVQTVCTDWNIPLYQRPQHIASAMADAGYVVVYLTANWTYDDVHGFEELSTNLFVTNRLDFIRYINNAVLSFYSTSDIYTMEDISLIRRNSNLILYEYIDHIDTRISAERTDKLLQLHDAVHRETVDIVACTSQQLVNDMAERFPMNRICYLPNGVNPEHYGKASKRDSDDPGPLRAVVARQKPVIGYFGALAPWLWYSMLNTLIDERPNLEFVFIGPDYLAGSELLSRASNVHVTGVVPYAELPTVASFFDVAMIPFEPGRIAQTTSPLKLYEYLALGKPVVVTEDMYECLAFERVLPARDAGQFSRRIDEALSLRGDDTYREWALNVARQNSWFNRAQTLCDFIDHYRSGTERGRATDAVPE